MILLDTNVILALLDPADENHADAKRQAPEMYQQGLILVLPVLAELTHFLRKPYLYDRLQDIINALAVRFEPTETLIDQPAIVQWLRRYARHKPDYADAYLVALTLKRPRWRVWSFDHEFATIWRRSDGSAVPMALKR